MALFLQRVQTVGSSLISAIVKYLNWLSPHLKYFYNQILGAKKSSSTSYILFARLSSFTDFLSRCKSPRVLLGIIVGVCRPATSSLGGDSAYQRSGDARRKFWIKFLKKTDLGVAQVFWIPKRGHVKTQTNEKTWIIYMNAVIGSWWKIYMSNLYFFIFLRATLNETFTAKYDGVLPRTP